LARWKMGKCSRHSPEYLRINEESDCSERVEKLLSLLAASVYPARWQRKLHDFLNILSTLRK
jgi:hypothetical protein